MLPPVIAAEVMLRGEKGHTLVARSDSSGLAMFSAVAEGLWVMTVRDFERRRHAGVPSATVSREQIERLSPINLSRMLRGLSGLQIADSLGSIVAVSTRGAKPTRFTNGRPGFAFVQCVMRVSIDGFRLPALTNIDEIVPNDVHGIEIYFGPARTPPELAGLRTNNWCGLIAV